ncbi:hypothetical protein O4H49_09215 [Kiloniella laminariae]|uniref:EAL domain-containing protein n=1 Tax=Kiloniella laminariae TaxID=454162 RepID=A0ABT4LIM6_9PROT|nr:hypothetical protein [Kiloniella laminariae]MCZ4280954.1 hypothetical protein [Kiloniella laminariae]
MENSFSSTAPEGPFNQEKVFLDFVKRIGKQTDNRRAVHIHLSRLRPYHQREHHLRIAQNACEELIAKFQGTLFRLINNDIVLVTNGATITQIDETILRLRYLFSDDPMLAGDYDLEADQFCTWFDLTRQYAELIALAIQKNEELEALKLREKAEAIAAINGKPPELPTTPLAPSQLAAVAQAINQADLSSLLKRQAIFLVNEDRKPEPLFKELFFSIEQLQKTLLPTHNLLSNRWLFQDLTRYLDKRMLVILRQNDDSTLTRSYSLNLNVATALSNEFLKLDQTLGASVRKSIVIEFQLLDVFADVGSFTFARDFLKERGYKICLDGITHLSMPMIDRRKMGFDLVKLQWNQDLTKFLTTSRAEDIRATVQKIDPNRMILCHCGAVEAIKTAQDLGIKLMQGFYIDEYVRNYGRNQKEETRNLADAIGRHRAEADHS